MKTIEDFECELQIAQDALETFNYGNMTEGEKRRKRVYLEDCVHKAENKLKAAILKEENKNNRIKASIEKRNENTSELQSAMSELINDFNYVYVQKQDVYIRMIDNVYEFFKPQSLPRRHYVLDDPEVFHQFRVMLEVLNKKYDRVTHSFRSDLPKSDFNLSSKEGWVLPILNNNDEPYEYHWLFDDLMYSLGGGKRENINHIEQVLIHKIINPANFKLPALVIYGEGSVGKNLFVDVVCHTIFAGATISEKAERVMGHFNSLIAGKAVVLINEGKAAKAEMETFKNNVHKPRLTINTKCVIEYEADNTPLYIFGSNDLESAIRLGGDKSDRRWSIIKVKYSLASKVAERLDTTEELAERFIIDNDMKILGNPEEIAKWLGALVVRWGSLDAPRALHGEDYKALVKQQAPEWEEFLFEIFGHRDFINIEKQVLFEGYKHKTRDQEFQYKKNSFYAYVEKWLESYKDKNIRIDTSKAGGRKRDVYCNSEIPDSESVDTTLKYCTMRKNLAGETIFIWKNKMNDDEEKISNG